MKPTASAASVIELAAARLRAADGGEPFGRGFVAGRRERWVGGPFPANVGFQPVQGGLDLPALVIERGQFLGAGEFGIENTLTSVGWPCGP